MAGKMQMGKKVAVIIQTSPLNTLKSIEAFRMSVGLTLEGNHVDILLLGNGVWNALPINSKKIERPDVNQFMDALEMCGIGAYVESEAFPPSGQSGIRAGFKKKSKSELIQMIHHAEVVISY
jgi:sulfur relay (sulfurtransferase) DsrF/TusC family protein